MTLNLMPAELVAKIAEDEFSRFLGCGEDDLEPTTQFKLAVRHAWIVAAQALEERADWFRQGCPSEWTHGDGGFIRIASVPTELHKIAEEELRSAARALRRAAREDVEP